MLPEPMPARYAFLVGSVPATVAAGTPPPVDLCVLVDGAPGRLGPLAPWFESAGARAIVDHHRSSRPEQAEVALIDHGRLPVCDAEALYSPAAEPSEAVCVEGRVHQGNAAPWVAPQPGIDPCSECVAVPYELDGVWYLKVYLAMEEKYEGYALVDPTLTLDKAAAIDLTPYAPEAWAMTGGETLYLSGVKCPDCAQRPTTVKLSLRADLDTKAGCASTSQLVVY